MVSHMSLNHLVTCEPSRPPVPTQTRCNLEEHLICQLQAGLLVNIPQSLPQASVMGNLTSPICGIPNPRDCGNPEYNNPRKYGMYLQLLTPDNFASPMVLCHTYACSQVVACEIKMGTYSTAAAVYEMY